MGFLLDRYFWWLPVGTVPEISAEELKKALDTKSGRLQLLDVRTAPEWRKGAIRGTILVPISILSQQIEALPFDRDRPVIAICRSARRSIPAVRILKAAGYRDVRQLRGGMLAWEALAYPTIRPQ